MTTPGWAAGAWPRERLLSYFPTSSADPEPAYAVADAWEPPHELALPLDVCDRVRAAASRAHAIPSGNGTYFMPDLDPADETAILERFRAANALWWKVDVDDWFIGVSVTAPASGTRSTKTCMPERRGGSSRASCSSATATSTTAAPWS